MRLIDADKLTDVINRSYLTQSEKRLFNIKIRHAPTVELDESVIQKVLNKRCMTVVTNEYLIALHGKKPQGKWLKSDVPERPQGEWINTRPPEMSDNIVCSLCGYDSIASFNYCPNCGADMRGKEE